MEHPTIWIAHEHGTFLEECRRHLDELDMDAEAVRWRDLLARGAAASAPRGWVVADQREVEALAPDLLAALGTLGWRLILIADRAVPPEVLGNGWVVLQRPFTCNDLSLALHSGLRV